MSAKRQAAATNEAAEDEEPTEEESGPGDGAKHREWDGCPMFPKPARGSSDKKYKYIKVGVEPGYIRVRKSIDGLVVACPWKLDFVTFSPEHVAKRWGIGTYVAELVSTADRGENQRIFSRTLHVEEGESGLPFPGTNWTDEEAMRAARGKDEEGDEEEDDEEEGDEEEGDEEEEERPKPGAKRQARVAAAGPDDRPRDRSPAERRPDDLRPSDRRPYDERDRRPYDERDRRPYDERDRRPYDERDRRPYDERDRRPYDDRYDRAPSERGLARQDAHQQSDGPPRDAGWMGLVAALMPVAGTYIQSREAAELRRAEAEQRREEAREAAELRRAEAEQRREEAREERAREERRLEREREEARAEAKRREDQQRIDDRRREDEERRRADREVAERQFQATLALSQRGEKNAKDVVAASAELMRTSQGGDPVLAMRMEEMSRQLREIQAGGNSSQDLVQAIEKAQAIVRAANGGGGGGGGGSAAPTKSGTDWEGFVAKAIEAVGPQVVATLMQAAIGLISKSPSGPGAALPAPADQAPQQQTFEPAPEPYMPSQPGT